MGSSASKAARTANKTVRKYPTRVPPPQTTTNAPSNRPAAATFAGPTVHPQIQASASKEAAITRDASDPDLAFNARLAQLGPVQPSPTLSHSSTFNTSTRLPTSPPRPSPAPRSGAPTQQRNTSPSVGSTPSATFQASASAPAQSVFPLSSAASNPAVTLLAARARLAREAEEEFEGLGRKGARGRGFLDVVTIRQVLMMRDEQRRRPEEIEEALGLRSGVVAKLGPRGLYSGAGA